MHTKSLAVKSIGDGTATVVFATLEVVDKDGDYTPRGAFGEQTATIAGAHNWSVPTLGAAKIYERGSEALADLKFNLALPEAAAWFQAVKFNHDHGVAQEWSYGFDILRHSFASIEDKHVRVLELLKVHEISPVMIGAGVNTRTLAVKTCQSCAGKSRTLSVRDELVAALETNEALLKRLRQFDAFTQKGRVFDIGESYRNDVKRWQRQAAEIAARVAPNEPAANLDPALVASVRSNLSRFAGLA